MNRIIDGGCTNSDLILNVRKKTIRFKAGAELSSNVNKMNVDVTEEQDDKYESLTVSLSLGQQKCQRGI